MSTPISAIITATVCLLIPGIVINNCNLLNNLETTIEEYCKEEAGLVISDIFQEELVQITEKVLRNHEKDGIVMSAIEGTYFFHAIFNRMDPDLYVSWCEFEQRVLNDYSFIQENKNAKISYLKTSPIDNAWGFKLPEILLVQELKRIIQHRFHSLQENYTIELQHSGDLIHLQPASSEVLGKELLNLFIKIDQVEKKFDVIVGNLNPIH